MIIITDSIKFAQSCIPACERWREQRVSEFDENVAALIAGLFDSETVMVNKQIRSPHWDYLFAVDRASRSQYDVLAKLAVSGQPPPDKTLCCAAEGLEFHGFKNRSWQAMRGNIHLSAYIRPGKEISGAAAGFIVAAVISVLQAINAFDLNGAVPAIKWVNDVLIDHRKVGGVLARLQMLGKQTESAVLGIGLNVSQRPPVLHDSYVSGSAAIADFIDDTQGCEHLDVFPRLIECLGQNLNELLDGNYARLLDAYRQHSLVLGREVSIYRDTTDASSRLIASGRVESIGDALELFLKGVPKPITNGRLKLDPI